MTFLLALSPWTFSSVLGHPTMNNDLDHASTKACWAGMCGQLPTTILACFSGHVVGVRAWIVAVSLCGRTQQRGSSSVASSRCAARTRRGEDDGGFGSEGSPLSGWRPGDVKLRTVSVVRQGQPRERSRVRDRRKPSNTVAADRVTRNNTFHTLGLRRTCQRCPS